MLKTYYVCVNVDKNYGGWHEITASSNEEAIKNASGWIGKCESFAVRLSNKEQELIFEYKKEEK